MSQFSNVRRWVTRILEIPHRVGVGGQHGFSGASQRAKGRSLESGTQIRRIDPSVADRASQRVSTNAIVCATGPLADQLEDLFPDPNVLTLVDQRAAFVDAVRTVNAASVVAVTSGGTGPPERLLASAYAAWPTARLVWFEARRRPQLSANARRSLRAATLAGPFRDGRDLASLLCAEIERGVSERRRQVLAGRRYAEFFGLPELGARLAIGVAVGVPSQRLPDLLEHDPERFRQYCSRVVYPRTGVGSIGELQASVYTFERRMDIDEDVDGSDRLDTEG